MVMTMYTLQKFQERKATFDKGSFKDAQEKDKWKSILKIEIMSSDESDYDGDKEVIVSHPLPWLNRTDDRHQQEV